MHVLWLFSHVFIDEHKTSQNSLMNKGSIIDKHPLPTLILSHYPPAWIRAYLDREPGSIMVGQHRDFIIQCEFHPLQSYILESSAQMDCVSCTLGHHDGNVINIMSALMLHSTSHISIILHNLTVEPAPFDLLLGMYDLRG